MSAQNSSDKSHKVLVLHSYHQGYYWTDEVNKGIFETFSSNKNIEVYVEYLDAIRNKSIQHFQLLDVLYKTRYTQNEIKFDVIIVSDDVAFNYLLERREELFFNVPVVFMGVDDFSPERIKGLKDVTGVNVKPSVKETAEVALHLSPFAKRLAVISGSRATERIFLQHFENIAPLFMDKVEIVYLTEMEEDELVENLKKLQPDDIVLYLSWLLTPTGKNFSVAQALQIITGSTNCRIFGIRDFTLNHGVIGGKVVHAYSHGEAASQIAIDIINKVNVKDPSRMESPNQYVFNGTLLRKYDISEKYLPDNSLIINRDTDFLLENWDHITKNTFFGYDLFENHGSPMLLIDASSGFILDANRAAFNFYGYPDLVGKNISDINMLTVSEVEAELARANRFSRNFFHFKHLLSSNLVRDVEVYSYPVLLGNTEVLFSMVVDVTDRYEAEAKVKKAYVWTISLALIGLIVLSIFILLLLKNIKSRNLTKKELQESEKRYRELFNNVLDIVFSCDLKGNVLSINKVAYDILGVKAIVGCNVNDFLSQESRHNIWLNLKNAIRKGKSEFILETQISNLQGAIIYLDVNGHIKYTEQGKPREIFAIARNINAQKEINRNILKTVINTEEKERRRIAAELHDGIGPLLSGLKMYLQQDSLIENMAPRQAKILSYSQQLVDDAIQQARSIANNLTPGILNDFGLEKALATYITKVNALEKCDVKFETSTGLSRLAGDESLVIYRVITELINNALKHASSQEIIVHIEIIENTLLMFYSDDGKGFDVENVLSNPEKNGMGIANIFNRITTLDGKILMDRNRSGVGMFANIRIPIGQIK